MVDWFVSWLVRRVCAWFPIQPGRYTSMSVCWLEWFAGWLVDWTVSVNRDWLREFGHLFFSAVIRIIPLKPCKLCQIHTTELTGIQRWRSHSCAHVHDKQKHEVDSWIQPRLKYPELWINKGKVSQSVFQWVSERKGDLYRWTLKMIESPPRRFALLFENWQKQINWAY